MKIALLLTRSVIYPSMAFDIMDGFKSSLKKLGIDEKHEIVSANIGVGGKNEEIYICCEQLLLNNTDIVVAYINPLAAEFINPLFENSGKSLIVIDSGYQFPHFHGKLSNTHFISLEGNLCSRVIVNKAVEEGKKHFAFTCSFYDAGYRPPYTFSTSAEEKGALVCYNHVTPLQKSDINLAPLAEYLEQNTDVALLASFCGDMAQDFFRDAAKFESITAATTYGSGFTAEEFWLNKIPHPGYDWSCAVPWSIHLLNKQNQEFVTTMENIRANKANVFSLLGWEAGLFIAASNGKSLDKITINSPRGNVFMNSETGFSEAPVYYAQVAKNEKTGNCILENIKEVNNLSEERVRLQQHIIAVQNESSNSWFNAYACLES